MHAVRSPHLRFMKKLLFVLCLLVSLVPYVSAESYYVSAKSYSDKELADLVIKSDNGDGESSQKLCVYYSNQGKAELVRHYLFKGAKQGNKWSIIFLARAYENGERGISKDYKEAIKWYYKLQSCEDYEVANSALWASLGLSSMNNGYFFHMTDNQIYLAALDERKYLRTYFKEINARLTMRPPGSKVDIDLVKVVAAGSDPSASGGTYRRYGEKTVSNKIEIYFDEINKRYPYRNTAESFWKRQVQLVDTCTHELAHVYFSQRYPLLANCSDESKKRLYEGHATNAAYEYMKREFWCGVLTPEKYAELFLTPEYKGYFFWFRTNCLMPDEKEVMWYKIDTWEREAARGEEPYTRAQAAWKD